MHLLGLGIDLMSPRLPPKTSSTPVSKSTTFPIVCCIYGVWGFIFLMFLGFGLKRGWPLGKALAESTENGDPVIVAASLHFVLFAFGLLMYLRRRRVSSPTPQVQTAIN
ncbi:hypothetical protein P9112_010747 [Eukaryota sp. TZLM1-RC]